jgi:hypothetical protein
MWWVTWRALFTQPITGICAPCRSRMTCSRLEPSTAVFLRSCRCMSSSPRTPGLTLVAGMPQLVHFEDLSWD